MASEESKSEFPDRCRLLWGIVLAVYVVAAAGFSVILPLDRVPDEKAHVQYARFLATERRLPLWSPSGGGEAGYEAQHPPLFYAGGAVVAALAGGLPLNWQWYALRWYTLALGVVFLFVARGFFLEFFRGRQRTALLATGILLLTPALLLHFAHTNPDSLSILCCTLVLWKAMRVARGEGSARDRLVMAAGLGVGLLSKLTAVGALPVLVAAHLLDPSVDPERPWRQRAGRLGASILVVALLSGWWYGRSFALYGTPFPHTTPVQPPGLYYLQDPDAAWVAIDLAVRSTYLGIWVPRYWLPPGICETGLYWLLGALLLLAAAVTVRESGRRRKGLRPAGPASGLSWLLFGTVLAGLQYQVWMVDYGWNSGGRYLLNALPGVHATILAALGSARWGRVWQALWAFVFVAMTLSSAYYILTYLNPRYAPGWEWFQFPPQE